MDYWTDPISSFNNYCRDKKLQRYSSQELVDLTSSEIRNKILELTRRNYESENTPGGGFLVQRSIRGRAAEMGLKISLLV